VIYSGTLLKCFIKIKNKKFGFPSVSNNIISFTSKEDFAWKFGQILNKEIGTIKDKKRPNLKNQSDEIYDWLKLIPTKKKEIKDDEIEDNNQWDIIIDDQKEVISSIKWWNVKKNIKENNINYETYNDWDILPDHIKIWSYATVKVGNYTLKITKIKSGISTYEDGGLFKIGINWKTWYMLAWNKEDVKNYDTYNWLCTNNYLDDDHIIGIDGDTNYSFRFYIKNFILESTGLNVWNSGDYQLKTIAKSLEVYNCTPP